MLQLDSHEGSETSPCFLLSRDDITAPNTFTLQLENCSLTGVSDACVVIRGDVSICAETALSSLKGCTITEYACPLLSPSLSSLYTCLPHCSHPIVLTSSHLLKHSFSLCHPLQLLSRHRNAGASASCTTGRISTLAACKSVCV